MKITLMNVLRHNKFELLIFRGSVAKYLRCGGQRYVGFVTVANFILFLAVKKFEDRLSLGQISAN